MHVPLNEPCSFWSLPNGERIVLASYPRSGNSLLRRLLESMTGIITGSDTKPGRGMAELLRKDGLIGEGETSQRVWTIKCHFPERLGWKYFKANRCILLVRHPINAIKSYFHMQLTASHHLSLAPTEFTRFPEFDKHVAMERISSPTRIAKAKYSCNYRKVRRLVNKQGRRDEANLSFLYKQGR